MKILHIITHYYPHVYGAENFAQHLAEHQVKKGNQVCVITGLWNRKWEKEETVNGVNIYRVKTTKIRYFQTLLAIIPLFSKAHLLLKKKKIDLVHTHIYPAMIVASFLRTFFKFRFIATIQGGDIGDYPENFGPWPKIFKLIIAWALKKADMVHAVSNDLKNQLVKMEIEKKKIIVIPNGIDLKMFQGKKRNKDKDQKESISFITTSRLEKKNNLIQLIEIIGKLRKRELNLTLDIYGRGSQEKLLTTLIKDLSLERFVKLKGYLENNKLPQVLVKHDYFIRLSLQEGFGISFLEAMACGLIPIGTKTGGIVDFIKPDYNGYLIDLKKPVLEQIEKVLKESDQWGNLSRQAHLTVEKKFTWGKIYPQIEKLYKKIL